MTIDLQRLHAAISALVDGECRADYPGKVQLATGLTIEESRELSEAVFGFVEQGVASAAPLSEASLIVVTVPDATTSAYALHVSRKLREMFGRPVLVLPLGASVVGVR